MKGIKLGKYINKREFRLYLFFSILVIVTLISIRTLNFTQARYESSVVSNVSPTLAFFVVGVESTSGQIKLAGMVPRTEPYLYSFEVSNFSGTERANVDLTYSIEIITTTNMPLNFRIYKGNNTTNNEVDSDTTTADANGVYYRHLVINDVSTMNYNTPTTDRYTLWVEFPRSYMNYPAEYAGIIDLVDIKINAEQVV
jgi:hypothetical protein